MNHEMDDPLIARISAELQRPVRVSDEVEARVMEHIAEHPRRTGVGALLDWLLRPRALELSPAMVAVGGVVLLALAVGGTWELARRDRPQPMGMDVAQQANGHVVQFVFVAPGAQTVSLVGDFNGWDTGATPMQKRSKAGVWTVSLPLPVGRHQYAFVIDQQRWEADPAAPSVVADDFGTPSSVVTVALNGDA